MSTRYTSRYEEIFPWCAAHPDPKSARCKWCNKAFKIDTMGKKAFSSHEKGRGHQRQAAVRGIDFQIHNYPASNKCPSNDFEMAINDIALSWKDHNNVLISVFEKLLEKESLVDCTLAAEGKFLKAHKIVLSACSPYLETLLNQEKDKHPIIFLKDVEFENLKKIVKFVYSGEIKIPEDHLVEFLNLADALQIKGLVNAENKAAGAKHDDTSSRRSTTSSIPKKRLRCDSKFSNSSDDNENSFDNSLQSKKFRHRREMVNVIDIDSSPRKTIDVAEDSNDEIQVKEEIIDFVPAINSSVIEEQFTCVPDVNVINEELSEVKKEFEEVTFTENYSEDMLPEENEENTAGQSVVEPVRDEPSTSNQYVGYSSDFNTSGLEARVPYVGGDGKQQLSGSNSVVQKRSLPVENSSNGDVERSRGSIDGAEDTWRNTSAPLDKPLRFRCNLCSKSFTTKSDLRRHSPSHTGEKRLQCSLCPSRFSRVDVLKKHLRTHTKKTSYWCAYCPATFCQSYLFKAHLRNHETEKPHQCESCSDSFALPEDLDAHLRTHLGEKS